MSCCFGIEKAFEYYLENKFILYYNTFLPNSTIADFNLLTQQITNEFQDALGKLERCPGKDCSRVAKVLANAALSFQNPIIISLFDTQLVFLNFETPILFQEYADFLFKSRQNCHCFKSILDAVDRFANRRVDIILFNGVSTSYSLSFNSEEIISGFLKCLNKLPCCEAADTVEQLYYLSFLNRAYLLTYQFFGVINLQKLNYLNDINQNNLNESINNVLSVCGPCCPEIQKAYLKFYQQFVPFGVVSNKILDEIAYNQDTNSLIEEFQRGLQKISGACNCEKAASLLADAAIITSVTIVFAFQNNRRDLIPRVQEDFRDYVFKIQKFACCPCDCPEDFEFELPASN